MALTLEDSTTYQLILERGIAQGISMEAQSLILRLGAKRFGPPAPEIETALRTITNREQLERMVDAMFDAKDWADLIAGANTTTPP